MSPFDIQYSKNVLDIQHLYLNANVSLYSYARYAFLEVLKKLDTKSVYLPSFICRDMLAPINTLNIKYYFYEVNEKLEPILEDIKCDIILMVNYFGFEQDIEPFKQYKNKYDAIIIEDNAHGFLSSDKNNNLLGTKGDIGLLSIRKTISLPNGGALLINNEKLNIEPDKCIVKNSFEDDKYYQKLKIKKLFFSKYLGVSFVLFRRLLRYLKTGHTIPLPNKEDEYQLPTNSKLTPILENSSLNIDIDYEKTRRVNMYKDIQQWAKRFDIKPIYELYDGAVPFEFAFINNGRYKEFKRYLYLQGFFILPWPDLPDEVTDKCPKFYKNVKVVPFLW
jgi:hypothetical protein